MTNKRLIFLLISLLPYCLKSQSTADFSTRIVRCGLEMPWEITYAPDGWLWTTETRGYRISRINIGTGEGQVLVDLSSNKNFPKYPSVSPQGGLMGLALHPNLTTGKPFVYAAYVYRFDTCLAQPNGCFFKTKVVRFSYNAINQSLINEEILCDTISGSDDHNGGRLAIGQVNGQSYLFYTVGDMGAGQFGNGNRPNKAQQTNSYEGKILRFNLEKNAVTNSWIPTDNPFNNAVWSIGHRNPQGLVFANNKLYEAEHGPYSDDEINIIERGANYGFPLVAGFPDGNYDGAAVGFGTGVPLIASEQNNATALGAAYRNPLASFFPETNANIKMVYQNFANNTVPVSNYFLSWNSLAPSGIDFYGNGAITNWNNSLLVTSLKRRRLYRLKLNTEGSAFVSDTLPLFEEMGRFRDIAIHPSGEKIYISFDSEGQTSGPTAGTTIDPANKGCIVEFAYKPCINDITPPVFASCPANLTVNTPNTTAIATWTPPMVRDSCGTPSVSSNFSSGFAFPVGVSTVVYTATDSRGNRSNCSFKVTVDVKNGVSESLNEGDVNLSPNPNEGEFTVSLNSNYAHETTYFVENAIGQTLKTGRLDVTTGKNEWVFSYSDFPKGVYFIKMKGIKTVLRFVKI
jgi:PQQ-dependent dehydrogenase (s-GDH family)